MAFSMPVWTLGLESATHFVRTWNNKKREKRTKMKRQEFVLVVVYLNLLPMNLSMANQGA